MCITNIKRKDINLWMLLFIGEWVEFDLEILTQCSQELRNRTMTDNFGIYQYFKGG